MSTAIANQLFLAYLGRPADVQWQSITGTVLNGAAPSVAMQTAFYNAAVADGRFAATDTPSVLVNKIFTNIFGFGASTFEQTAWGNLISNGSLSAATAAWTIFSSYLGATNVPPAYQQPVQSKLIAIQAYTSELANNPAANAAYSVAGSTAAAGGRTFIDGVTSQATAASAISTVAATVSASGTTTGSSFTLTTGADNLNGTANNDTFDASQNSAGTNTLSSLDSINGGGGTDTLSAIVNGGGAIAPASLSNVEIVNVSSTAANSGINVSGATGITNLNLSGSTAAAVATGIQSTSVAVGVRNTGSNATFTFADAALAGSSDTVSLTIENVTGGTIVVQPASATNGPETLAITSRGTGTNTVTEINDGTGTSLKTLNITATTGLTVTNAFDTVVTNVAVTGTGGVSATFNAGAATVTGGSGNDTFSFAANAGAVSVTGGAGNDTFSFSGTTQTFTSADTVDGGDGVDQLRVTTTDAQAITSALTRLTNIESVRITDASTNSINFTHFGSGVNAIVYAEGVNTAGTDTVNGGATTITFRGTANAGAAYTVSVNGSGTTDSVAIVTDAANALNNKNYTFTGAETVSIAASQIAQTVGNITVNGTGGANTTLNFTGGFSVTSSGILEAKTIDASGITVASSDTGFVMNTAATTNTAQTITGSGGVDTLIGTSGADSITAGAGNDAITAGAGNDTIVAGAGNDTITFGDNYTTGDSIDGGDGTDTLSLSSGTVTALNALSLSAVTVLNGRLSNVERVSFSNDPGASFDLARVGSISHVTLAAQSNSGYTLSSFSDGGTLVIRNNNTNSVTATLADASASNNTFNLTLTNAASTNLGTVTIGGTASSAQVETVTLTGNEATASSTVRTHTITLGVSTGLKTLNLAGTETLAVTANSDSLATVDASALSEGGANVTATSSIVNLTFTGSGQNDTISAGSGADSLSGGAGDDQITGGSGNDTISGGAGNDSLVAGVGVDSISGGDGSGDTLSLTGWTINTTTDGGSTAVQGLVANGGTTSITAATISGYIGFDTAAAISSDLSAVGAGQVVRLGAAATIGARVTTFEGIENYTGSGGKDYIVGSSAAQTIDGGAGIDVLSGGAGADTFVGIGTAGQSVAATGNTLAATIANGNTITFNNGVDVITDFVSGTDKLDVAGAGGAAPTNLVGLAPATTALTANTLYGARGDYVIGTGVFTLSATGADYIVLTANAGHATLAALAGDTGWAVLRGVTALVNADLI